WAFDVGRWMFDVFRSPQLLNPSTPQRLLSAFRYPLSSQHLNASTFSSFSLFALTVLDSNPWTDSSMLQSSNSLVITPSPKPICTLVFGKKLTGRWSGLKCR